MALSCRSLAKGGGRRPEHSPIDRAGFRGIDHPTTRWYSAGMVPRRARSWHQALRDATSRGGGGVSLVCDLLVGTVFLLAGILKWRAPSPAKQFIEQLTSLRLPTAGINAVGLLEWVLGILLLAGLCPLLARSVAGLVLALFSGVLAVAYFRSGQESCPCLGASTSIPTALARNGVLLSLVVVAYLSHHATLIQKGTKR